MLLKMAGKFQPSYDGAWELNVQELTEYRNKHGHCNVPQLWPENQKLSNWVKGVRAAHRAWANRPRHEVQCEAKDCGKWRVLPAKVNPTSLNEQFFCEDSYWISDPSCERLQDEEEGQVQPGVRITPERVNQLENLGFAWNKNDADWEKNFSMLIKYHMDNDHYNVSKEEPKLNNWLNKQRQEFRKYEKNGFSARMTPERVKRLKAIGFPFPSMRGRVPRKVKILKPAIRKTPTAKAHEKIQSACIGGPANPLEGTTYAKEPDFPEPISDDKYSLLPDLEDTNLGFDLDMDLGPGPVPDPDSDMDLNLEQDPDPDMDLEPPAAAGRVSAWIGGPESAPETPTEPPCPPPTSQSFNDNMLGEIERMRNENAFLKAQSITGSVGGKSKRKKRKSRIKSLRKKRKSLRKKRKSKRKKRKSRIKSKKQFH